jgi:hypothetical protein
MLDELKDATQNIDPSLQVQDIDKKFDRAYQFDFTKWTKYANSMRMRLAMRLSEVDPEKAKSEFEDAAKGSLILTENDMFAVQERDGWDPLAGVMSRPWNALLMSNTLNNLMINLGGVKSEDMLDASYAAHIKTGRIYGYPTPEPVLHIHQRSFNRLLLRWTSQYHRPQSL